MVLGLVRFGGVWALGWDRNFWEEGLERGLRVWKGWGLGKK